MKIRTCAGLLALLFGACSDPSSTGSAGAGSGPSTATSEATRNSEATILPGFSNPMREDESNAEPTAEVIVDPSPIEAALGIVIDPHELAKEVQDVWINRTDFITACVQAEGFVGWIERTPDSPTANQIAAASSSPLTTLSSAGYGVSLSLNGTWQTILDSKQSSEGDKDPIDAYLETLPEHERQVFIETRGGCNAQAREALPEPVSMPEQIAAEVADVRSDALQAAEVQVASMAWATCMRRDGHEVATRFEAMDYVWGQSIEVQEYLNGYLGTATVPGEAEIRRFAELITHLEEIEATLVESDLRCAEETDEMEIRRLLVWRAEEAWLAQNEDRVALLLGE